MGADIRVWQHRPLRYFAQAGHARANRSHPRCARPSWHSKRRPNDVRIVVAHELGHWKKRHTLLLLATSQVQIAFSLSIFRFFLWNPALFSSFGFSPLTSPSLLGKTLRWGSTDETYPIVVGFVLAHHLFNPLNAVLTFLVHSLSRALEYQADRFAKDLGYSAALKWALVRISVENKATTSFDWLYSAFHRQFGAVSATFKRMGS